MVSASMPTNTAISYACEVLMLVSFWQLIHVSCATYRVRLQHGSSMAARAECAVGVGVQLQGLQQA